MMTKVTTTEPYWDPYHADQRKAPYEAWRRLRDEAPVYHNERFGFWALSRFSDVLAASLDTETFSSARGITLDTIGDPIPLPDDDHDGSAPPRRLPEGRQPGLHAAPDRRPRGSHPPAVRGYLDPFVGAGGFDFVQDFGMRLPVMVISTLLGLPRGGPRPAPGVERHRPPPRGGQGGTDAGGRGGPGPHDRLLPVADRAAAPPAQRRHDHGSRWRRISTTPDGEVRKLDDLEVMGMMALISNAGNETVARMLGWAALVLDEYPDARREMAEDPSLIPVGVEELLRYEAPSPIQGRYVTRDVEMHGTVIPEGAKLALLTGSAGRDERKYPDPDTYDIHRSIDRHVTFGYGAHYCLGAALARMEGKVALTEVLRRFPTWEVDRSAVTYVATNTVRGPSSVPVSF